MPKNFFDLPQELRDRIYQELLEGVTIISRYNLQDLVFNSTIRFGGSGSKDIPAYLLEWASGYSPWLLTSEAIMAEAGSELSRHGTTTTLKYKDWSRPDPNHSHSTTTALLGPLASRKLLILSEPTEYGFCLWRTSPPWMEAYKLNKVFARLVNSRVEDLHMVVEVDGDTQDHQGWTHFEPLRSAVKLGGQLKRFEIQVNENVSGNHARHAFDSSLLHGINVIGAGLRDGATDEQTGEDDSRLSRKFKELCFHAGLVGHTARAPTTFREMGGVGRCKFQVGRWCIASLPSTDRPNKCHFEMPSRQQHSSHHRA